MDVSNYPKWTQRIDQGLNDLQENVYQNAVSVDRVKEDCRRQIAQSLSSSSQQVSMEAYQEHARGTENALEQYLSQLAGQDRRIQDGEVQLRHLQGEVAELSQRQTPQVGEGSSSNRGPELAIRLAQLEDGLKSQQRAFEQFQEDSVEDARSVKRYLDQVHEMVTSFLQREQDPPPPTPERTRPEATRLTAAGRFKGGSPRLRLLSGRRDCLVSL